MKRIVIKPKSFKAHCRQLIANKLWKQKRIRLTDLINNHNSHSPSPDFQRWLNWRYSTMVFDIPGQMIEIEGYDPKDIKVITAKINALDEVDRMVQEIIVRLDTNTENQSPTPEVPNEATATNELPTE